MLQNVLRNVYIAVNHFGVYSQCVGMGETDDKQVNKGICFLYNRRCSEESDHVEICRPWKRLRTHFTLDETRTMVNLV